MKQGVIVTGGTRGLGLSIVKQVVEGGKHAYVIARTKTQEIEDLEKQSKATFLKFDLEETSGYKDLVKSIFRDCDEVVGLVNNAALGLDGVLGTMHDSEIMKCLHVNVTATIMLTKQVSRLMLLQGKAASIVNVSSIIAKTGYNGLSAYAASKAALIGFTRSLARELGREKIRVNAVCPGFMETDMTGALEDDKLSMIKRRSCMGRFASLDEVANVVLFMLSPLSSGMTGSEIVVDAGSIA